MIRNVWVIASNPSIRKDRDSKLLQNFFIYQYVRRQSQKNWIFINTDMRSSDFGLAKIFSYADVTNREIILKYMTEKFELQEWYRLSFVF
jgi:hypothetical protein